MSTIEKQQIPVLTRSELPLAEQLLATSKETAKLNSILFDGYAKIVTLLAEPDNIDKMAINKIIADTMAQISNP